MNEVKTERITIGLLAAAKLRDYAQLVKFRLSMLVIFSSVIGFLMAANGNWEWPQMLLLILAGFLTTASSNALNQVIEKDYDRLMKRTANRPLPTERMTNAEALLAAGIFGVAGISIFWIYFNQLAALFSALALLSYAFIYTPLKRFSPIAVLVGAIPGALPPLIGWVSATGHLSPVAFALFGIQFMWQFPHFWAIAWVGHDDYMRAGYKLLPSKDGRSKFSAIQIMLYILVLIPVSLVPAWMEISGIFSAVIVLVCGIVFLVQSIFLIRQCSIEAAKKLMFGSFFYLPVVQLAIYFDRL
ncbi:MAG: protoheme IX farnesyltransferase [Chitinophagaceae bacterium]|nr:protoheme IX farnesyltransferase [Chitinophagaceae bacterium]